MEIIVKNRSNIIITITATIDTVNKMVENRVITILKPRLLLILKISHHYDDEYDYDYDCYYCPINCPLT